MKRSSKWVWIGAFLAVLLVLAVPLPVRSAAPANRTFRIQASRFQYSPSILQVNPGDRVTLEITTTDVVHGLLIDGYNLSVNADPGQTARLTFVAGRAGAFRFRCTATCGNMHPFMIGKLYVGQDTLLYRAVGLSLLIVGLGVWKLWK